MAGPEADFKAVGQKQLRLLAAGFRGSPGGAQALPGGFRPTTIYKGGSMKAFAISSAILAALAFSGCASAGFDGDAATDIITPGVSVETSVRTWDANGRPVERRVKNDPAFLYDSEIPK